MKQTENPELLKLKSLCDKHRSDVKAIEKSLKEHKEALEISKRNLSTFNEEKRKWVIKNIDKLLAELPAIGSVLNILVMPTSHILLRITLKDKIYEYDESNGWQIASRD